MDNIKVKEHKHIDEHMKSEHAVPPHKHHSEHYAAHAAGHKVHHDHVKAMCGGGYMGKK